MSLKNLVTVTLKQEGILSMPVWLLHLVSNIYLALEFSMKHTTSVATPRPAGKNIF
jgi:hypothetical protein